MFENTILIIVSNHAINCNNIHFLKDLYGEFFKDIVFYSDICRQGEEELAGINYIDISGGWLFYKVLMHFRENFPEAFNSSEGIFYSMDDNLINVKELKKYDTNKIIYEYNTTDPEFIPINELKPVDSHYGWHWGVRRDTIHSLLKDEEFTSKYPSFNLVRAQFADYFFLPKRYLNNTFFDLLKYMYKHKVILEIAIPTVMRFIEPEEENYFKFNNIALWEVADREKLKDKDYFYNTVKNNLFTHPVKYNSFNEFREWTREALHE